MNSLFHPGAIVADQYQLLYPLGKGGSGLTYAALDKKTHAHIALKIFNPSRIKDWKKVELFEREIRTLKALDHPGIPKYLGCASFQCQGRTFFAISQELVPGKSLSEWISQGWRPGERTVKQIAAQVLEILSYLQSLIPPVIHRDIKPENIIYFPNTSDQGDKGIIYLVDFGAVQEKLHDATLGSTVVGTFGYIAPEQYRGQAFLSTDLYGLGTTLVYLLTAKHPADLPHHRMKVDFRHSANLSDGLCSWIDALIEPNYQDRIPGAAYALQVLQGERSLM
ncbi:MAG: serine/threonine protein kinase [Synechococcaceae cyanobacterium SM2_3_1]|nr:serine/threonine protein kinase [Synechococcaceae cyanobacterium SM2_3_1]